MNTEDIYKQLNAALDKLNAGDIDDNAKLDLEILILQIKKQILVGGFEPLKEISNVTIADTTKLSGLISEIDNVLTDEIKRGALVTKIVSIAKIALKAAGLPIPS